MLKKVIAVLMIIIIFGWGSWNFYTTSGSVLAGILFVPAALIFGGIGGMIGMFFCKAFKL